MKRDPESYKYSIADPRKKKNKKRSKRVYVIEDIIDYVYDPRKEFKLFHFLIKW